MNYSEFIKKFQIKLTAAQSEAVQEFSSPVLLLAVPGSGKTTTLVARIGYMIYCLGIDPKKILTITYTNAATEDMKKRFACTFGDQYAKEVNFKTINSLSMRILNEYARLKGSTPFQTSDQQMPLLKEIYLRFAEDYPAEGDLAELQQKIAYIKNMMLSEEESKKLKLSNDMDIYPLYTAYNQAMRERKLMDYDDQLVYAYRALLHPEVRDIIKAVYSVVLVDEAQDTSKIQHEIIRLISEDAKNLFMVGDEDQSIYGFRAAYPEALMEFEKNHQGKVMLLEENFRSSKKIVEKAGILIRHNRARQFKNMTAVRQQEGAVNVRKLYSRKAQYGYIAQWLKNSEPSQTAILFRNNENMIPYLLKFQEEDIPYTLKAKDATFFKSRTVMDARNVLCFAFDQNNMELFRKVYGKLGCYLKKSEAEAAVRLYHQDAASTIWEAMKMVSPKNGKRIGEVEDFLQDIAEQNKSEDALSILTYHIFSKLGKGLDEEKMYILRALSRKNESVSEYLDKLTMLERCMERGAKGQGEVILSTIHASKGLEYDQVIIADAVDGILPSSVQQAGACSLEEERRLFYVAMTRARESLTILEYEHEKQPFLHELKPPEDLRPGNAKQKPKVEGFADAIHSRNELSAGMAVMHKRFGLGRIEEVDMDSITIDFQGERKRFSLAICLQNNLLKQGEQ